MSQYEVSDRGRALWRTLAGADGVGRSIRAELTQFTHEDVNLLAAELRDLVVIVGSEARRRDKLAQASGMTHHDGGNT